MVLKKNSEWEKITTEFNASHGVHQRTCIQLKSLWKNMKSRTKTAVARDRREKAKTGGGPQADTELDSLHTAISTMLPQQINSIGNEFDDDAALHGDLDKNTSPNKEARCVVSCNEMPSAHNSASTTPPIIKRKLSGKQEQVKSRLLEMAEHAAKMRVYQLKEDILILKKRKLEESLSISTETNRPSTSNSVCSAWRPL
ncbi:uncharacterized protein LOC125669809 [Ostrea edulis]|uniref:uncharacterized protein LOC125669809 n=1 Tax=Ostrea edulis TaxID=37623 RepID=UPI0024AFFF50|nr:uncharacterized protein LOC125669809 [Ostrea edulis]